MVYPIHIMSRPGLRQLAHEVPADYPDLEKLVADMFETMQSSEGVGLAAPQIGLPIRLFVIDASPFADEKPDLAGFKRVFVNPEILERKGPKAYFNEGCLSVPGIHEDVLRETIVRVRYNDEHLQPHEEEFDGIPARIIQHEYDHLEGILFTDRLSPIRKQLLRTKLNAIQKGHFKAKYNFLR